jgi:YVTN family beta-propeller protein
MLTSARPPRTFVISVLLGALLLAACNRSTSSSSSPASAGPEAADAGNGPRVYVSDETGSAVVVVDPDAGRVVQRLAIGKRPRGIKLATDGKHLLVALSGSPIGGPGVDESTLPPADRAADGIGLVELPGGALVRKYQSGQDPESFAISPDGKTLYVSNEDAAEMSVLDLESGNIRGRVKVGEEPEGVTVRPDGRVVYVSCEGANEVVAIDTKTLAVVAHITTGARPRSIVFTTDGTTGFVTSENTGTVSVFDTATHAVTTTIQLPKSENSPTPPRPMGAVLARDNSQLYVSLGRAKSVAVIDVAARKVARIIEDVGARPWGIGLSADGKQLYTANGPSGDVSVVDIASGKTEKRIPVGGSPWGIAVKASS